eukprot:6307113-Ditylum_brightwellii.AAC.1
MKLNLTLTNKGIFTPNLVGYMKDVMFEYKNKDAGEMIANAQKAEVQRQQLRTWVQDNHPNTPNDKVYVPKLVLKSGVRKWGNSVKQVQAPVLIIEWVASETAYLK